MDQQAGLQPATIPEEPTVASVLGVKGQLRFHPHGSTQKAHVVLRQVELSDESDDEGDSSMVYFSLFAQKRIEVKPGKEILLAVASPDGTLLESGKNFEVHMSRCFLAHDGMHWRGQAGTKDISSIGTRTPGEEKIASGV